MFGQNQVSDRRNIVLIVVVAVFGVVVFFIDIEHPMRTRKHRKLHEKKSRTNRYYKSAIPYMTRLLNEENEIRNKFMKY